MKTLKTIFILIIIGFISAYAGSPYYTAYQLKQAFDNKDGVALVQHIDFEQLRPNISSQLQSKFSNTLSQYPMVAKIGGKALTKTADKFIQTSVSKAITADNISQLIITQGQANQASKQLAAAWAIASNRINLTQLIQDIISEHGNIDNVAHKHIQLMTKQLEQQAQANTENEQPALNYCGINCFKLSGQVKGFPLTVQMQRQGLFTWKITDVKLP